MSEYDVDCIVVGGGPAGSIAALVLARAGRRVVLLERGPFPGSKNMYGGVVYGRVLDRLLPEWHEEAPIQRWVTRRSTMVMTDHQALTIDFRTEAWGDDTHHYTGDSGKPYNGATAFRPDFDAWLADKAVAAGATLVCSTTATGLLRDDTGVICGVTTDRPDGDLRAPLVIACDGVNSFLAKEAGLHPNHHAGHYTLGAKETIGLSKEIIDERFGVRGRDGVDIEILGATQGIPGGGFVYTNLDSVSIGVVIGLEGLKEAGVRPEQLIADLKAHPAIAPLIEGGEVKEYSAHLIPEGGYDAMPELSTAGMLVAGDAAGMCLAAGIWLEGVNFAMGSGAAAAEVALAALRKQDYSAAFLESYRTRLEKSFVLADHKKFRAAPHLVLSDRVQKQYPAMICDLVESVFTVNNPTPKPGMNKILRTVAKDHGIRIRDLAKDGLQGLKIFG